MPMCRSNKNIIDRLFRAFFSFVLSLTMLGLGSIFNMMPAYALENVPVDTTFADPSEYAVLDQDLKELAKQTDQSINMAKEVQLAVPYEKIEANYKNGMDSAQQFRDAYQAGDYKTADSKLSQARLSFGQAMSLSMVRKEVEARCVWFDRGSIVDSRGPEKLVQRIDELHKAGFNQVYFECNNAAYALYHSEELPLNPEIRRDWDPLATAVEACHQRGMSCHAWCWNFAVGNMKHNQLIGKDDDYPGPVLEKHGLDWALRNAKGELVPYRQTEFWLDPSNPECRNFAKNLLLEIVEKYPVDGVQLDYIRYPFNNKGFEVGFNKLSKQRFESEHAEYIAKDPANNSLTPANLDKNDTLRRLFRYWKIKQVDTFVEDACKALKKAKPDLIVSAAVYGFNKPLREHAIQQVYEPWLAKGYVDVLNPMTYVMRAYDIIDYAGNVFEANQEHALVYPGMAISRVDTAELIREIDYLRDLRSHGGQANASGYTAFANVHLNPERLTILGEGVFSKQAALPHSKPLDQSKRLFDTFSLLAARYTECSESCQLGYASAMESLGVVETSPVKPVLACSAENAAVLKEIEQVRLELAQLSERSSSKDIESVLKKMRNLEARSVDWLRLEAYANRSNRSKYVVGYLHQSASILSYVLTQSRFQEN